MIRAPAIIGLILSVQRTAARARISTDPTIKAGVREIPLHLDLHKLHFSILDLDNITFRLGDDLVHEGTAENVAVTARLSLGRFREIVIQDVKCVTRGNAATARSGLQYLTHFRLTRAIRHAHKRAAALRADALIAPLHDLRDLLFHRLILSSLLVWFLL